MAYSSLCMWKYYQTSPHRRGLPFVYLDLTFVSSFSVQHDEDLGCAARFAIGYWFYYLFYYL